VTLAAGAGGISTTRSDGNSIQTPGGISAGGGIAATGQVSGGSFGAIHSVAGIAADGAISTANTGSNSLVAAGGASIGGALGVGGAISVTGGNGISAGQYVSTVGGGTGIAPFVVSSSALVDNLNVLLHNGARASVSPSAGTIPIAVHQVVRMCAQKVGRRRAPPLLVLFRPLSDNPRRGLIGSRQRRG